MLPKMELQLRLLKNVLHGTYQDKIILHMLCILSNAYPDRTIKHEAELDNIAR